MLHSPCGHHDAIAERRAVGRGLGLISHLIGRTNVVAGSRRYAVAKIEGAQTLDHAKLEENSGRAIGIPGFTALIPPNADVGWCPENRNRPVHKSPEIVFENRSDATCAQRRHERPDLFGESHH
jgi:hypothetical protein